MRPVGMAVEEHGLADGVGADEARVERLAAPLLEVVRRLVVATDHLDLGVLRAGLECSTRS